MVIQIARRQLLAGSALGAAWLVTAPQAAAQSAGPAKLKPAPLKSVRLKPSIWLDAVNVNRAYLLSLEPDRLLHNFRVSAGLKAKGEVYGGWEARGIAGHTLGHYLTALALMHAQTGDIECVERARYTIAELATIQAAHGDGYVGGTTVERGGKEVDGKVVFEEVRRGDIRSGGFDLNEGWVPLYTWHKVHAGLLDVHEHMGDAQALKIAVGTCEYLGGVFDALSEEQMQKVLAAEHGGLNETFAETYVRTGEKRWLAIAERIRHRRVLDPLSAERDELDGKHANTQIPKVIGLARLYEVTGDEKQATAARFFWDTVTKNHSYVIGGNSEREHFGKPRELGDRVTDQTCEACNTYNMLKLTRHLYSWTPDAAYFDYYERAHLNHILAHQHPKTGMFVYFTPMLSGVGRKYSTPTGDFWCCVGSGIESHAKHGDSIYWQSADALYVNLFIPSQLDWKERGLAVEMDTLYPAADVVNLKIVKAGSAQTTLALRLPAWCESPSLTVNGKAEIITRQGGYAVLKRRWRAGDRIVLTLPMTIYSEALPGAPDTLAFLHGPKVLAVDLGPTAEAFDSPMPALVAADARNVLRPSGEGFTTGEAGRPGPLTLKPFFTQYDSRTAVYLPTFTQARWQAEEATFKAEQVARRALDARTVDVLHMGEMQPERDHDFRSFNSEPAQYRGRSGRLIRAAGFIEFTLASRSGPMILRLTEWGEARNPNYKVFIDDVQLQLARRPTDKVKAFHDTDLPIPEEMTRHKDRLKIRIEGTWPTFYGARLLSAPSAGAT